MSNLVLSKPHEISAESTIFRHYCQTEHHQKLIIPTQKDFDQKINFFETPHLKVHNPLFEIWKQSEQVLFASKYSPILRINDEIVYTVNEKIFQGFDIIPNTKEEYTKIWHKHFYNEWLNSSLEGMMNQLFSTKIDYEKHYNEMKSAGFFARFEFVQQSNEFQMSTRDLLKRKNINMHIREIATTNFSWSVPSNNSIQKIIDYTKDQTIVNICSGKGYWSYILTQVGIKVISVDQNIANSCLYFDEGKLNKKVSDPQPFVTTIIQEASDYIKKNDGCKSNVLFMSWMDDCEIVDKCLQQYKGDKVIIICEDSNGCTGSITDYKNWTLCETITIPRFHGIFDEMQFFKRSVQ